MPISCSVYSSGCMRRRNSRAQASGWPLFNASSRGMEVVFGRKARSIKAQRFTSRYLKPESSQSRTPMSRRSGRHESDLSNLDLFLDRDLSLIEFQKRVFDEARDDSNPLLERVKFLGIVGANIDEFIMVRAPEFEAQAPIKSLQTEILEL